MFNPFFLRPASGRRVARIALEDIRLDPNRPRRSISAESVKSLADSIRRHGQLDPVLVRRMGRSYQLIAGHRRVKALRLLGRSHVDAIVIAADDCDAAMIALAEDLQHAPLHYLDAAEACRRALDRHPITRDRLAAALSISPSALFERLRLLRLPVEVRDALRRAPLTERHARALLRLTDAEEQLALVREAAERHMSARQLEARITHTLRPRPAVSAVVRDNRIIINALLDTVKALRHIGVYVQSRVEEHADRIDVVVTIPIHKPQP